MNIGINASSISSVKGGASFYMVNIIRALGSIDKSNNYFVFCTTSNSSLLPSLPDNFRIVTCAPSKTLIRLVWEQTVLPLKICRNYNIEVLFSPNYTSPVIKPGLKSCVTIFDLSFFPLAKLYPLQRRLFRSIIKLSVIRADTIIATSAFTREDVLRFIRHADEKKIHVIHAAVDDRFKVKPSEEAIAHVKKKYRLENPYILFIGFLEPRKNLGRLLEAFASVKDRIKHDLVIVGGKGWWYESTFEKVKSLGISDRVVFTGYAPDEDLPALYKGAALFAIPSLYEGFGIAPLEAVCCGTPVLASGNTCLPEVLGDAAIYVDPYDITDIAAKLLGILQSEEKLSALRNNCPSVSERYSWEKAAKESVQLFLDTTRGNSPPRK